MIQDYIFAAGSILFILSMIPALRSTEKPPRSTCFLTGSVLYVFAGCQLTLELTFAAATTIILATMWYGLLLQPRLVDKSVEV